eukprot:4378141-Prymnesium_polylepis.2
MGIWSAGAPVAAAEELAREGQHSPPGGRLGRGKAGADVAAAGVGSVAGGLSGLAGLVGTLGRVVAPGRPVADEQAIDNHVEPELAPELEQGPVEGSVDGVPAQRKAPAPLLRDGRVT